MNFNDFEKIMSSKGMKSLAEIARALNTTPQAVSNWKSREQVPYHIVTKIRDEESNINNLPLLINRNINNQIFIDNSPVTLSDFLLVIAQQLKIIVYKCLA